MRIAATVLVGGAWLLGCNALIGLELGEPEDGEPPGTTPAECIPRDTPDIVGNGCGVFVGGDFADDINLGTKAAPVATLARALELTPRAKRIYACAAEFAEAVKVPAGVEIYGGLDCATFAYVEGQKTTIAPAADRVPLTLLSGAGARIEGVIAKAAHAAAPGGSSIAVIAQEGAAASLVECELDAGAGASGEKGVGVEVRAPDGASGNPGKMGCDSPALVDGGEARVNVACNDSIGGAGGPGSVTQGFPGGVGSPGMVSGGNGQLSDATMCTDGMNGPPGESGKAGKGAAGMGTISDAGFTGVAGAAGLSPGAPGKGGGGGGGGKGASVCGVITNAGPSGGSGASGGCGGVVGNGGGPGGSSIGLLSHRAEITLTAVAISTSAGGGGGTGADGQEGGFGGSIGGEGGMGACSGGKGGKGGRGGAGGGGLGGHSIGMAFVGTAPSSTAVMITTGDRGDGGGGGDGDTTLRGADGEACQTLNFDEPDTCSK